jgi:hypothetical protein
MVTRRTFVATAALAGASTAAAGFLLHARRKASADYERAVGRTWRHSVAGAADRRATMLELVRCATLAPSSHNTQCWKFRLRDSGIEILPDYQRRCPVVDPDDHHLFVSLGCAAQNLIEAAAAMGLQGEASLGSAGEESCLVSLEAARPVRSPLFECIPFRQSSRVEFDGRALSNDELRLLEAAGTGDGVGVRLLTDQRDLENVLALVIAGNSAQMRDPAFVKELKSWIRFDEAHAVRTGDGLYSGSSGNPSVPSWLGSLLFDMFFAEAEENDKYARHLRSSAGVAVFVSDVDDRAHWIEAGRAFQRFALQATALGVRHAHVNQPVEVAPLRQKLAEALGVTDGRPDLVVRFGRGPTMPRSLRRPLDAVLTY